MASRRRTSSRLVFEQKDCPLLGVVMFGRFQHTVSASALRPHTHRDAIEICFLERGEQTFRVKGRSYRMRGYDQFFTLPGEIHDTANLPEERGILYWLILSLGTSMRLLDLAAKPARELDQQLRQMPTRHFRAHPDCSPILGKITELLSERQAHPANLPAYHQLRLQSLFLDYLTLTIEASHHGAQGFASALIQRVLHYIDRNLNEPIHVPSLAQVARLSESRFKARFKREMGVPPAEYWLRKKIEKAGTLLKTQSVTKVAHDLGFSSSQYFATVFKRYTLTTPSQFRAEKKMMPRRQT